MYTLPSLCIQELIAVKQKKVNANWMGTWYYVKQLAYKLQLQAGILFDGDRVCVYGCDKARELRQVGAKEGRQNP